MANARERSTSVDARLRELARLSQEGVPARAAVGMSAEEITARLLELAEVSALCFALSGLERL